MRKSLIAKCMVVLLVCSFLHPILAANESYAEVREANEPVNLALGKAVEASTSYVGSGWAPNLVVDGARTGINTGRGEKGWTSQPNSAPSTEWIKIDLGTEAIIDKIQLWPRNDEGTNVGYYFPVDFSIQLSTDGVNWTTVASKTNYPAPTNGGSQEFSFAAAAARYVKVEGTQLRYSDNVYAMQLAEIEVYEAASGMSDEDAVAAAAAVLDLDGLDEVTGNLNLPTSGLENTMTAWTSSDLSYLSNEGVLLHRPNASEGDKLLTLTATISRGGVSVNKPFAVTVKAYAPNPWDGKTNLALNKLITASSSYEGSGWSPRQAVNGTRTGINTATGDKGWTSQPYQGEMHPEWISIDLGYVDRIDQVVLWPRNDEGTNVGYGFPLDFDIQVSVDNEEWTTVAAATGYPMPTAGGGRSFEFDSKYARYIKIEGTKLTKDVFNTYVMQFAEVEVYQAISQLSDNDAVEVGAEWLKLDSEKTTNVYTNMKLPTFSMENTSVTWSSSKPDYVRDNGTLVKRPSASEGILTVTMTAKVSRGEASATKDFDITLKPYPNVPTVPDNRFIMAVFWPPAKDYVNETQYDYLAEANINYIEVVETGDLSEVETNDKMLDLAGERGIQVSVSPKEDMSHWTEEQVAEFVNHFKPHPATGGYFIRDEPVALQDFYDSARLLKQVKALDPDRLPHLNLLPNSTDWETWTGLVGASNLDYLTFDFYPFSESNGLGPDYYSLLDKVRKTGVKNGYKTAGYLQSVGISGRLARPTEENISFEVYSMLAYGFKKLTWFTWWTPTGRGEPFTNAIITSDGQKTDLFEPVQRMNAVVEKIGPTLMTLDAKDVYHVGELPQDGVALPSSFYVQPIMEPNSDDNLLVTDFVQKDTGRRYVMVVNKSMDNVDVPTTFTLQIDPRSGIKSVTEVSQTTGAETATDFDAETSRFTAELLPGQGRLYAMPESFIRHYPKPSEVSVLDNPTPDNLAFGKHAHASSDIGPEWGWNARFAVDGKRDSTAASMGWSNSKDTNINHTEWITIDLGSDQEIGAVSLFPRSDGYNTGSGFPEDFTIQVSSDQENWQVVHTTTGFTNHPSDPVQYTFPTVPARYVKVEATKLALDGANTYRMQFAEIEVYRDASSFSNLRLMSSPSELFVGQQSATRLSRLLLDDSRQPIGAEDVVFTSLNPDIAIVDAGGMLTGVSAGIASIRATVTLAGGGTEERTFPIVVKQLSNPWKAEFKRGGDGMIEEFSGNRYEILAEGSGMKNEGDQYVYMHQVLDAHQEMSLNVKVEDLRYAQGTDGTAGAAGILLRGSGSVELPASAFLSVSPEGQVSLSYRETGGILQTIAGSYVQFPVELKMTKQSGQVTGYYKQNNQWVPLAGEKEDSTVSVNFGSELAGGIASYSGVTGSYIAADLSEPLIQEISSGGNGEHSGGGGYTGNGGSGIELYLNGNSMSGILAADVKSDGGHKKTVVTFDTNKLAAQLATVKDGYVLSIPVDNDSDSVVWEFDAQLLSDLYKHGAVFEMKSGDASYKLPIRQLAIESLRPFFNADTSAHGAAIRIEISSVNDVASAWLAKAAGNVQLIAPAVQFNVEIEYNGETKTIDRFNSYVERSIALPADFDPSSTITGVIVKEDGSIMPVPTRVEHIGGRYYAIISSRTNSVYAIVRHTVAFSDMAGHWSMTDVEELGARLVATGTPDGRFLPDQEVTRAEFAAMLVRALGLSQSEKTTEFADVTVAEWSNTAIAAASAYGLVEGYPDGTFRPKDYITREQAMTLLARAINIVGGLALEQEEEALLTYADGSMVSVWAKKSVNEVLRAGLVNGRSNNRLAPQAEFSRAEAATIIIRLLRKSNLI